MSYQKVILPKCTVLLTNEELHSLLLTNMDLYRTGLIRSKKLERYENQSGRSVKKLSDYESEELNRHIQ
jgi:hypothetical protein